MEGLFSLSQRNCSCKVLLVCDSFEKHAIYEKEFRGKCNLKLVSDAAEAKLLLADLNQNIAVVVSNIANEPDVNIELLQYSRECHPDVIRILFASASLNNDPDLISHAINVCAVQQFLKASSEQGDVRDAVLSAIELYSRRADSQLALWDAAYLYEEFKNACDRWTLHNVNLNEELLALDYGLCGILSVYKARLQTLPNQQDSNEFRLKMEEYVDNIMCSSMLFAQGDINGQALLLQPDEYKH